MTAPAKPRRRKDDGVGVRLRQLREATGHTRAAVAHIMHVTVSAVTNWELGHRQPTFDVVERYCDAIGAYIHIGLDNQAHTEPKEN